MKKFGMVMNKGYFMCLAARLVEGNSRIGHVNSKSGLRLSDFRGWDDWFGFGEWNGEKDAHITCYVHETNENGIKFLTQYGFYEEFMDEEELF